MKEDDVAKTENQTNIKEISINKLKGIINFLLFLLIVGSIAVFLYSDETRIVPKTESYSVIEKEAYQEPYQEAIYNYVNKTIYDDVIVNETHYYGVLCTEDGRHIKKIIVGGNEELEGGCKSGWNYTAAIDVSGYGTSVTITWFNNKIQTFDTIHAWTKNSYQYSKKVSVPKIIQEQVIERYETRYRTVYKDVTNKKTRIRDESVTKSRFEWYFNRS